MEGRARAKKYLMNSKSCFCFKTKDAKIKEDLIIQNKKAKVRKTLEPDLIQWNNYRVSKRSRQFRTVVFWLFNILLLIGSFYTQHTLENYRWKLRSQFPSHMTCSKRENFVEVAFDSYLFEKGSSLQSGAFYCYCE